MANCCIIGLHFNPDNYTLHARFRNENWSQHSTVLCGAARCHHRRQSWGIPFGPLAKPCKSASFRTALRGTIARLQGVPLPIPVVCFTFGCSIRVLVHPSLSCVSAVVAGVGQCRQRPDFRNTPINTPLAHWCRCCASQFSGKLYIRGKWDFLMPRPRLERAPQHSYEITCTMFNRNLELSAMRIPESSIAEHTETLKGRKFDPLATIETETCANCLFSGMKKCPSLSVKPIALWTFFVCNTIS